MPPIKKRPTKKSPSKPKRNWSAILYGPNGIGKTSLCAHLPQPFFIIDHRERGIIKLAERNLLPKPRGRAVAYSWKELLASLNPNNIPASVHHVIIESVTGIESMCFDSVCKEHYGDDKAAFYSYHKGPRQAAKFEWPRLTDAIAEIEEAGYNVILTGHSKVKTWANPTGDDFDRFELDCDKEIWQKTKAWGQAVLFFNYEYTIDKTKQKGLKAKARDSISRVIYANQSPLWDAKNWLGLPDSISVGSDPAEAAKAFLETIS